MDAPGKALCALLFGFALAGSVHAAAMKAPSSESAAPQDTPTAPSTQRISDRLRADLAKAGFTEITIMPSSFIVRAKDSEGHPVMMMISPESTTEVSEHRDAPLSGAIQGSPNSAIPAPKP